MRALCTAALWAALLLFSCTRGSTEASDDAAEPAANSEIREEGSQGTNGAPDEDAADAEPERDPILVRAEPVEVGAIRRKLEVTARVESLDVAEVMPEHNEPVEKVLVEEGDRVEAGEALATLRGRSCELRRDEAEVRKRETYNAWQQAIRNHERNQQLFAEQGSLGASVVSEQTLETSKQAVLSAETAHEAAKVLLERAEFDLNNCTLRSPIAGTVSMRDISVGDRAIPGRIAFQIVDLSAPKAIFYRPQRELALLQRGQKLTATSEALPGRIIPGHIERISPTVDPASGTVKVTAALTPEGERLPTGILVDIVLVLDAHENALLVPKRALLYEGREPYCFVIRNERAVRIECEPGFEDPNRLEVLPSEDGLRAGDLVVVVGADRLSPGDPVELADE